MSHFSVMVIGDDVEGQLAPYHEFECTGCDDQYVQEIDEVEDYRQSYESKTVTIFKKSETIPAVAAGEGAMLPAKTRVVTVREYDGQLYRDLNEAESQVVESVIKELEQSGSRVTSFTFSMRLQGRLKNYRLSPSDSEIPELKIYDPEGLGWEKCEVPVKEQQNFLSYVRDETELSVLTKPYKSGEEGNGKYGYILVDEDMNVTKVIRRTNPNAKWDWYVEGGRWSNRLLLKDRKNEAGEPVEFRVDSAKAQDIDFDSMRQKAREEALAEFDEYIAKYGELEKGYRVWDAILRECSTADEAREVYGSQPLIAEFRKEHPHAVLFGSNPDTFFAGTDLSIDERRLRYAKQAEFKSVSTYALVKGGQWAGRGNMGWFGISLNEMDEEVWQTKFLEEIDMAIANNSLITIIDCHI